MNHLLAALPAAAWQRWLPSLEPVELTFGQVLCEAGRVPLYAYFPTTAVVSLLYMTEDGECDEVAVVGPEGVVGVSLFMGGSSTPGTASVQRAGWGFRLPAHTLKDEFEQSAAVMRVLLGYSLALTVQVAQTAVCSRHHMLDQRLCRRLLQGLDRQQDSELAMTQEQLARLLGVRRESITVEAQKLQKAGVVSYSRGHIFVLDRLALERRACECYAVVKKGFDRLAPEAAVLPAAFVDAEQAHAFAGVPESGGTDFATRLQETREQERGVLACEFHDELGALLTSAKLDVASLKSPPSGASVDSDQRLQHLGDLINLAIGFSRRLVEDLHASTLVNLGLTASLEILAGEFEKASGIGMATHLEEADIDDAAQLTLYRVAQEFLNASKYAEASDARIVLLDCGSDIVMTVRNNGRGFDKASVEASSHGLAGMRRRVESCGGQLTVTSEPGLRGTLIAAVLPKRTGTGDPAHAPRRASQAGVASRSASATGARRRLMH